jgi:hypothetical protein
MVIELVCFDGRFLELIEIVVVGMGVIFGILVIASITKLLEVFFEVVNAFGLITLLTSLKVFEKLKG